MKMDDLLNELLFLQEDLYSPMPIGHAGLRGCGETIADGGEPCWYCVMEGEIEHLRERIEREGIQA